VLQAGLVEQLNILAASERVQFTELAFYGSHSTVPIAEQLSRSAHCSLITGEHAILHAQVHAT